MVIFFVKTFTNIPVLNHTFWSTKIPALLIIKLKSDAPVTHLEPYSASYFWSKDPNWRGILITQEF